MSLGWPEDFINKIICGDCLEVMKDMPDGCVDLIITDPPRGIDLDYGKYCDNRDNLGELIKKIMPEILRVGKRVLIACGLLEINFYPQPDWILAWVYKGGNNRCSWGFQCWQPILAYGKDPYLQDGLGGRPDIIFDNRPPAKSEHPCPKPIQFWENLLLRGSVREEDVVLDPFLGSGTTVEVCKLTHRNFIGIEINPDYCKIAEERLAQGVL